MKYECITPQKQNTPKMRYARHCMFLKAGGTKYALFFALVYGEQGRGGSYRAKLKAQFALVARPTPLARYFSGNISLT